MKIGSLFAGIGGFDLGFERAGFEVAWCVEWDKNAQAVLRARFPNAKVYGDIREVDPAELEWVDVICGGFPCQDLSVAGKRAGLEGERSGLFHEAMRIVRGVRPRLAVVENVAGLLSSNLGHDFATVLRELGEGWTCEEVGWRVLDSRYFGVAQRRRRVFLVAGSSVGCAEQILALSEGGGGNHREGEKAGKDDTEDAGEGAVETSGKAEHNDKMIALAIQGTLIDRDLGGPTGAGIRQDGPMYTLTQTDIHAVAFGIDAEMNCSKDVIGCMQRGGEGGSQYAVAFTQIQREEVRDLGNLAGALSGQGTHQTNYVAHSVDMVAIEFTGSQTPKSAMNLQPCLTAANAVDCVFANHPKMSIRRLTPIECERLQGFPDGWTQIGTVEKPIADSHRYKQLGNAVTVNVAEWIARRAKRFLDGDHARDALKGTK